ncbi:Druantia anti-phage system protein DruA [Acidiplasma sp.]|uniref:Druantia anti-phage system protein DruA n=1 Tax=Acidiplasma sp. TaxID=1872114 RepID=UPI002588497C|nr:Druantia anti-phage system protein DruA [Acidiplasma sp.]
MNKAYNLDERLKLSSSQMKDDYLLSLQSEVKNNLLEIGFTISPEGKLILPENKDYYRKVQLESVNYILQKNRKFIEKYDEKYTERYIIDGKSLDVKNISPRLKLVENKEDSNIFRWIKMHWSIPISAGYGRRLRYIVKNENDNSIMGIIGLDDPVYALKCRDTFIGWSNEVKKFKLKHVMDAFVLGAVPPYSLVLGGKLIAALVSSPKIITDFNSKYNGTRSLISGEIFNGKLAAITTASALGKSSIYDRIKIPQGSEFIHVGWTKGSGEFQFANGIYDKLYNLASQSVQWSKNPLWGTGTRNRRVVIQEALKMLNLPSGFTYHNIKRELFFIPLGFKSVEYLKDKAKYIKYYPITQEEISRYMLKRWVIPRSERRKEYLEFRLEDYSLMNKL